MKGMTGYGRAVSDGLSKITVEVKSVNHRFLDLKLRGPHWTQALEDRIKAALKGRIDRGHVEIYIKEEEKKGETAAVKLDESLVNAYMAELQKLQTLIGSTESINLNHLLRFPGIIAVSEEEADLDSLWENLKPALDGAIDANLAMRVRDGEGHAADIRLRMAELSACADEFQRLTPDVAKRQEERLREKLAKRVESLDETRLEQEMVYYVDRFDITGLRNNMKQFMDLLDKDEPVGKRMDFLLQEMNREVNTIGSKGNDAGISTYVVTAKTTLEKIREQIQNIE